MLPVCTSCTLNMWDTYYDGKSRSVNFTIDGCQPVRVVDALRPPSRESSSVPSSTVTNSTPTVADEKDDDDVVLDDDSDGRGLKT